MQDTLAKRISAQKPLTEDECNNLVDIFGAYCAQKTKTRLYWAFRAVPHVSSYGIYSRVHLTPEPGYCAGQSYPDEIRTVRKYILGY